MTTEQAIALGFPVFTGVAVAATGLLVSWYYGRPRADLDKATILTEYERQYAEAVLGVRDRQIADEVRKAAEEAHRALDRAVGAATSAPHQAEPPLPLITR